MAEKYTIGVDIKNNADETEKDFKNLNETLDDTAKANDEVNKSFDKGATFAERYGKELEPLTTRMGEAEDRLYELSLAGDTASKEYQELLKNVGNYRKVQIQTDLAVDQAATTMSEKLGGALTGAASAFSAVQGVMAITGSESEALEESLLKVQGAMAFQQGVDGVLKYSKSIGLASKAQKAFNLILSLNPLALLVTTLVAIIGYFAVFTDAIEVAIQSLKNLTDWIGITGFAEEKRAKRQAEIAEKQAEYRKAEIEYLKAQGKSTAELEKQILREALAIKEREKERFAAFNNRQLEIAADIEILELKGKIAAIDKAEAERQKQYAADRLNATRQIQDAQVELLEEGSKKEIVENKLKFDRLREDTLKATNLTRKEKQKLIDLYDKQEMDSHKKIVDNFIAELERQQTETKNRIDAFNNSFQDEIEALAEENYKRFLTEQEIEILAVQDKYFRLETLAEGNAEALAEIEIAKMNELNDINLKYQQEEIEIEKATQEQKIAAVKNTLSTIANLAELFAGESEREQKKAFDIQKGVSISQGLISTYESAVQSYKSLAGVPVVGPALGFAAAAAAVSAGLLNVNQIRKQKFESTSGGTSASPSVSTGGVAGGTSAPSQPPSFNVVGQSGFNQIAGALSQQGPVRAFVVASEVTTQQQLDNAIVSTATLGN